MAIPTTSLQVAEAQALLDRLIAEHTPGHALQREFHEDAVEGQNYALDALLPFWQLTSEQDWDLCEKKWYLHEIARPEQPDGSVARSV